MTSSDQQERSTDTGTPWRRNQKGSIYMDKSKGSIYMEESERVYLHGGVRWGLFTWRSQKGSIYMKEPERVYLHRVRKGLLAQKDHGKGFWKVH